MSRSASPTYEKMSESEADEAPFSLLDLPAEIRTSIYLELLVASPHHVSHHVSLNGVDHDPPKRRWARDDDDRLFPGILRTCSQISSRNYTDIVS